MPSSKIVPQTDAVHFYEFKYADQQEEQGKTLHTKQTNIMSTGIVANVPIDKGKANVRVWVT